MTVPLVYAVWLALLSLCLGVLIGACVRRQRPRWPRFARNLSGPVLSGASDRFFRHDLSDTKEIG